MAKKPKRSSWQRAVFLEACKTLKPFADQFHYGEEIDGMAVVSEMERIIKKHGRPGSVAATALASAWAWLMTDEDVRSEAAAVSEDSVASEYYMVFWWLGTFHSITQRRPAVKRAAKKRRS